MSRQRIVWVLLFLLVGGFGTAAEAYVRLCKPVIPTVVSQEMVVGSSTLVYPHIGNLPSRQVEAALNGILRQEMDAFAARINTPQYTGNTQYTVGFNRNDIISLTLSESFYAQHAAHPMSFLKGFTMNVRDGHVYRLQDLFQADSDYEAVLKQQIQEQISTRKMVLLRPFDGIHAEQEFYLTEDSLVLYYQLYEYTPYYYGFPKFSIPYSELSGLLRPNIVQAIQKTK